MGLVQRDAERTAALDRGMRVWTVLEVGWSPLAGVRASFDVMSS
ncbi:hypothetical protein HDA32_004920 [Spinactinospora alkalitolerans]|uniref:Uncharacterized protein n=1 Tax=Spinactinospora alkalitolerans TaxID=687207 RepID=A0A852U7A5_9ACTN|nr:hypothetical protein [Spinactinospora alkalitolerans]NYE49800.1 hypothetical protein [Spinactinospora alkalitolerans]